MIWVNSARAWHQDLSDALGVPVDRQYRPRVPLGRVAKDDETAARWAEVFTAIGQAPFGGGACDELVSWQRDEYGRWHRQQRWSLTAPTY